MQDCQQQLPLGVCENKVGTAMPLGGLSVPASPAPVGSWQENPTPWDGASGLGCPRVSLVVCSGAVVSAVSPAHTWARQLLPPVQAVKAQPPLPWGQAEMVMTRSGLSSHHLLVGATCSLHPCVRVTSEHRTRAWAPTSLCRHVHACPSIRPPFVHVLYDALQLLLTMLQ